MVSHTMILKPRLIGEELFRVNRNISTFEFDELFAHVLTWKWKYEDLKLKRRGRPEVKSNYGVSTEDRKWKPGIVPAPPTFSFLPKQNKTTLCDRWLRVTENTLLLQLTLLCISNSQGNLRLGPDFIFFYGLFAELFPTRPLSGHQEHWIVCKLQYWKEDFEMSNSSASCIRKPRLLAKKAGNIRTRTNSLRRLGILSEKQRIQQIPLHSWAVPSVYLCKHRAAPELCCIRWRKRYD